MCWPVATASGSDGEMPRTRDARPLTLDVAPGRPRLAWHTTAEVPRGAAPRTTVVERVALGEGEGGRLILAGDNLDALHALAAEEVRADLVYLDQIGRAHV